MCPGQESNLDLVLRRDLFYPLNYRGGLCNVAYFISQGERPARCSYATLCNMNEILLWVLTAFLMFIGLVGTIIPGLPGLGFVFGGILLFAYMTGFSVVGVPFVLAAGVVALVALLADYAGSALGARAGGGRWKSVLSGVIGLTIGAVLFGPLGIFLGALGGAFIGALIEGVGHERALRVALYTMLGIIGSALVQFMLAFALIIGFIFALFL